MAALPAVLAVAQMAKAHADAQALAAAQEKQQKIKNQQVLEGALANYDQMDAIELEAQKQTIEDAQGVQKDFIAKKGRVNVMAAAMGTGGMSVHNQLTELERGKANSYDLILNNRQNNMENFKSQASAIRYGAAANMDVRAISRPSSAALALNVGATAIQGYTDYQKAETQAALNKPVKSGV